VVVFVDYMNVYQDFRRAFCTGTLLPTHGQFHPVMLAGLLTGKGPEFEEWHLTGTRVYSGRPTPDRNARAAAAADRQAAAWERAGATVLTRPLQYQRSGQARQKGVDVALAVDVVSMAHEGGYEIAVIASTDTDLVPSIEAVQRIRGTDRFPRVCVVSYNGMGKRLQLAGSGAQPYAFRLNRADYQAVRDTTIYVDSPDSVGPEDVPVD
jgi:hypothetical protein